MPAFVLFEAAGTTFALPAADVVEVLRMAAAAPVPGAPAYLRGVLDLRGALVPVVDVRVRLGARQRPARPEGQLIVVRSGARRVALEVDRVRDLVEVPADACQASAEWGVAAPLAAGALALSDGAVVVHAVDAWLAAADEAAPPAEPAP
jgi:purine-binding chemotaxis protein CheW